MKYFNETDLNLLKDPKYLEEFLQQYHSSLYQYFAQNIHKIGTYSNQDVEQVFLRNKTELLNSLHKPTSQWSGTELSSVNNIFHIHRKYHDGINLFLEQQVKETLYREYTPQRASELWSSFQTAYRKPPSQQTPQDLKLIKRILNINRKKGVGPSKEFTEVKASFVPRKLSKLEVIKIEERKLERQRIKNTIDSFVPPSPSPYTHVSIEDMAINLRMPLAPSGWQNMPNFSPRLIFMDTETTGWIEGSNKRSDIPLSVSTLYATMDRNTGKLYYVNSNERFYLPPNKNSKSYLSSIETHGLTIERLKELQKQGIQGNKYWNEQELQDIITEWTVQPSILVGHNVWEYDIQKALKAQHLLGSLQHIDTLDVTRGGIIGASSYTLTSLFKRATQGKGPEYYGINPHESGSDVIMNAFVFSKLFGAKNTLGVHHRTIEELNYILDNYDKASSAPFYRGSGVVIGTYGKYGNTDIGNYISVPKGYKRGGNILNISEEELDKAAMHIVEDDREQLLEDSSIMNDSLKSILGLQGVLQELTAALKEDRKNNGSTEFMYDFQESLNTFNGYKRLSLAQLYANKRLEDSEIEAILASQGMGYYSKDIITSANILKRKGEWKEYSDEYLRITRKGEQDSLYGKRLFDILQQEKWEGRYSSKEFQEKLKEANLYQRSKLTDKVDKLYNKGIIDDVQREELLQIETNGELAQSIAEVTQKAKEATNAWKSFTNIKMYDPNRLYVATQNQIGGVSSALSSVVPSFVNSPLSHITQSLSLQLAGAWEPYKNTLNAVSSIGNGVSAVGTGLLAANPVVGGIVIGAGQLFNLGSQIAGNIKETQINKEGYKVQQQIHGVGFLADYVSLPFKLLSSATKTLIRSFGLLGGSVLGLIKGLSSLTESALSGIGAQGNPLTMLTGQTYGGYMNSLGIDYASLLSPGSSSSMLEEFTNLRNMFMYGEVSSDKIIAGSLLGVSGNLYGSTNDPQGAFYGMVNDIFKLISNSDPISASNYMSLAKQLHSSLPSLLQTMDVFGVTDIRDLMNPSSRGIYWSPMTDTKAARGAYYEYQMAQVQRQESQKKAGTYLWGWVGKEAYNGMNKVFDAISTGDWETAVDRVVSLWDVLKGKLQELWTSFKGKFNIDADISIEGFMKSNLWEPIKLGAVDLAIKVLEWIQNKGIPAFMNVWSSLLDYMTEGIINIVGYLSSVNVDTKQLLENITKGTNDPWISIGPKLGFSDINPEATFKSKDAKIYEQFLWKSGLGSLDAKDPSKKASGPLFSTTSIGGLLTKGMSISSLESYAKGALSAGSTLRIEDSNAPLFGLSKGFTIQTEKDLEALLDWITIFNSGTDKDKSSGYFFYKNILPISSEFDKYTLPVREALETANVVSTQIVQNGILGNTLNSLKDAKITIEQKINGKEVASVTITPEGNTTSNIRDVTYIDGTLGVSTAVRKNY